MANVYLKAALLTLSVALVGFFLVSQIDAVRANELKGDVEGLLLQSESERLLFLYAQTMDNSSEALCAYLQKSAQAKSDKAFALSQRIQYYEKGNLLDANYDRIRDQYYLANAGLYLNMRSAEKYCGSSPYTTVLYFYRISPDCPNCRAQGGVLDGMRADYPMLRVFAFPIDTDNPVVNAFVERHGIADAPSLVVDDRVVLRGLQGESDLSVYIK
ncbi:MAG: hypothetical protein WC717_05190 [Candidatus Micrarchaeia archaeon]|jgi:hypothetical protein